MKADESGIAANASWIKRIFSSAIPEHFGSLRRRLSEGIL